MRKRFFTLEEQQILQSNKNVEKVTSTTVFYKYEFKQEAVELYYKGITACQIFENAGFDINMIGKENPTKILSKWRKCIKTKKNKIKNISIDNSKSNYSDKEIKKILARNKYLEAENDFLKKLKALENQFR